jgi:triacylglycerol lipase
MSNVKIDFDLFREHVIRAAVSYECPQEIRRQCDESSAIHIGLLGKLDLLVFLEVDDAEKVQWVVVRGTDNLKNAWTDVKIHERMDNSLGVPVHSGFLAGSCAAYDFLKDLLVPDYETRLTGHSLGGAVAAILMMRFSHEPMNLGACVTFGQPKVTNEEGVDRYRHLPLWRVINEDDFVPMTPPTLLTEEFHHFGHEVHLKGVGEYEVFTEHQSELSPDGDFWANIGDMDICDHHVDHYVTKITDIAAADEDD